MAYSEMVWCVLYQSKVLLVVTLGKKLRTNIRIYCRFISHFFFNSSMPFGFVRKPNGESFILESMDISGLSDDPLQLNKRKITFTGKLQ